ncbi:YceI family protein [Candidatus Falkowbacteria bacterium]|jgi:polyisoprenoid-binding protein YceI|nr:YceI family protein [Candidatus Falkowbacteria bacterium]
MKYKLIILFVAIFIFTGCNHNKIQEINTQPPAEELSQVTTYADDADIYIVDVEESAIFWTGRKVLINSEHKGIIKLKEGKIYIKGDREYLGGEFVIDMTSLETQDIEDPDSRQKMTDHLKGEDFFDVDNYPEAIIKTTAIEKYPPPTDPWVNHTISANLTIKDKTNNITFLTEIFESEGNLNAEGSFVIDRTKWDIKYGSDKFFTGLGDKVIDDFIEFRVILFAHKQETGPTE